jgi:hypothetical protein
LIDAEVRMLGDVFTPGMANSEAGRVIGQQLTGASLFLEGVMAEASPVGATNTFRASWASEYDANSLTATTFNAVEYALPIELGRKPAFIPIEPLQLWVKRKLGVTDEKEARGIAFAISKKAAKVGVPTNPAKYDNRGFVQANFEANIDNLNENFLNVIGSELVKALS